MQLNIGTLDVPGSHVERAKIKTKKCLYSRCKYKKINTPRVSRIMSLYANCRSVFFYRECKGRLPLTTSYLRMEIGMKAPYCANDSDEFEIRTGLDIT